MSRKRAFVYTLPVLLVACGPKPITVNVPPPPAEFLTCTKAPERPDLAPLTAYPAEDNGPIYRKGDVDARDLAIARYVIDLRAAYFDCNNNLAKVRDYYRSSE